MSVLEEARATWGRAADYPFGKEEAYPQHAAALGFDEHHDQDILDYGCGGGGDARSWVARGNRVVGVDIVAHNVQTAIQRFHKAGLPLLSHKERRDKIPADYPVYGNIPSSGGWASFRTLEDSVPLPFLGASFDVAASVGVLHHIPEPEPILAEMVRVLRPGGVVVVMLYTEHLSWRLASLIEGMVSTGLSWERAFGEFTDGPGCWARSYTEEAGRKFLTDAGLAVERIAVYNDADFRAFTARKP